MLTAGCPEVPGLLPRESSISDLPRWSSLSPYLGVPIFRSGGPRPKRSQKSQLHEEMKVTLEEVGGGGFPSRVMDFFSLHPISSSQDLTLPNILILTETLQDVHGMEPCSLHRNTLGILLAVLGVKKSIG